MSTHGGEETWLMTLKNTYSKLGNTKKQIPGEENNPEEKSKRRERNLRFKSHLSQYKHASLSDDSAAV
jgi:hypothetical protein